MLSYTQFEKILTIPTCFASVHWKKSTNWNWPVVELLHQILSCKATNILLFFSLALHILASCKERYGYKWLMQRVACACMHACNWLIRTWGPNYIMEFAKSWLTLKFYFNPSFYNRQTPTPLCLQSNNNHLCSWILWKFKSSIFYKLSDRLLKVQI